MFTTIAPRSLSFLFILFCSHNHIILFSRLLGQPFQLLLEARQLCNVAPGAVCEPLADAFQGAVDHLPADIDTYLDLTSEEEEEEEKEGRYHAGTSYKILLPPTGGSE